MKKEKTTQKISSVGGQAVLEGVMMRGSSAMALAVRNEDGEICLETYRLGGKKWFNKVPILRGVMSFISSLVSGMKMITRSAEIGSPEDESIGKGGMAIAILLGLLFAVGLFIVLPEFVAGLIKDYLLKGLDDAAKVLVYSLIGGIIRIIIFVLYLVFCSKMKEIRRTFMYHGAEHKTINCYEKGKPLTVENIKECSTVHRRCGTTFLFLVMMVSILLFALANWLFEVWNISFPNNKILQNLIQMGIKIALLPLVAGLAFEVLKLFAKLPYNLFTKIIMAPGLALQKLSTKQPDDDMIEVALKSFNAAMEMEQNTSVEEIKFPARRCIEVREYLASNLQKIEAEAAEADWILCHITGLRRNSLHSLKTIDGEDFEKIKEIINRRKNREPLDYILGYVEFYGQQINVNESVLIPRMETETLCEAAIKAINDKIKALKKTSQPVIAIDTADEAVAKNKDIEKNCVTVLDLCTGSGCIAAVVAKNTNAIVTATDISLEALETAKTNLDGLECKILQSDFFDNIENSFDIIVSNPPYIKGSEIDALQPEVACQPRLALDGGDDGLDCYRKIISATPRHLNSGGSVLLEIGHDQAVEVANLLAKDFEGITVIKDLSGSDRVITATKKTVKSER